MSVVSANSNPPARVSSPTDKHGAFKEYQARWAALRRSTEPVDRDTATTAVRLAYDYAGLNQPKSIVWCSGPYGLASTANPISRADGPNVNAALIDKVHGHVASSFDRRFLRSLHQVINVPDRLSSSISQAVRRYAMVGELQGWAFIGRAFSATGRVRDAVGLAGLRQTLLGPPELAWLGVYEYLRNVCGRMQETASLRPLWLLAQNVGWMLAHEHTCWLMERPTVIHHDATGRLHSARGPALLFPDGWSYYSWKGVHLPHWVIEQPQCITLQAIDGEPNGQVRRCMIEVMTPERFIAMGGATKVAHCEAGTLWRKSWWGDAWAAVEVVNGTPEKDGTFKHYFLQVPSHMNSARQAVAWTFGMSEKQYARLSLRT